MKIACLSDSRLPTNPAYPSHGLGQIVHAVATGLAERGHTVTLFAAPGSVFAAGRLITATDEKAFLQQDLTQYESIIDNTHEHLTGALLLPAIQVSHDREHRPTRNAVFPSEAHAHFWGFNRTNSRLVRNGVKCIDTVDFGERRGGYVAYLGTFYANKQPVAAVQAAQLTGVKLLMAGPTPPAPPPGAVYIGPLSGRDKFEFLYHADALLFPATVEAAPVTVLEAQSVGTPVIVSDFGGASENMAHGKTGFIACTVDEMAAAILRARGIDRAECVEWVRANRSEAQMVDGYEGLLEAVKAGATW